MSNVPYYFDQTTPPHTPPSVDASNILHKSSRIQPGTKRSYEGVQEKPRKKFKYTVQNRPGMSSIIDGAYTNPPVGNARVLSYEDIVEAQKRRDSREAAVKS